MGTVAALGLVSGGVAGGATGAGHVAVQGGQRAGEGFGQGYMPSVVAGEVVSQGPYTVSERGEGEQLQVDSQQVIVGARGLRAGNGASLFQPPVPDEREVSFRLLLHYASSVSHQKYHGVDIVTVRVESTR